MRSYSINVGGRSAAENILNKMEQRGIHGVINERNGQTFIDVEDENEIPKFIELLQEMKAVSINENRRNWTDDIGNTSIKLTHISLDNIPWTSSTLYVCLVCITIFILDWIMGYGHSGGTSLYDLLAMDGKEVASGQIWRLFTPALMHFGIFHISMNLVIFWIIGRAVEKYIGVIHFLTIVAITAIVGNIAEYLVLKNGNFGGLSGVVNGIIAYLYIISKAPGKKINVPDYLNGLFIVTVGALCIFSFFDFNIGNACHFGGFIAGLLVGVMDYLLIKHGLMKFKSSN